MLYLSKGLKSFFHRQVACSRPQASSGGFKAPILRPRQQGSIFVMALGHPVSAPKPLVMVPVLFEGGIQIIFYFAC